MKKLIVLLALSLSTVSYANTSVEDEAFSLLLRYNPFVENFNGEKVHFSDAIAPFLLTKIYASNKGTLGIATNSCKLVKNDYVCTFSVHKTDTELKQNGDYVKSENSLESSVVAVYTLDKTLTIIKKFNFYYAG